MLQTLCAQNICQSIPLSPKGAVTELWLKFQDQPPEDNAAEVMHWGENNRVMSSDAVTSNTKVYHEE